MSKYLNRKLLPDLVNEYINNLIVQKNLSQLSVNEYSSDLRLFFRYLVAIDHGLSSPSELPEDFDLSYLDRDFMQNISLSDVHNFLTYCKNERNNDATARMRKASAIRGYFKYIADKMNYIDVNPTIHLEVASKKKSLPKYLSLEQSLALLNSVNGENKERDYCILTLFLNCGLRLAELVALNTKDINFDDKSMIVTGKGNKQRIVYLNKACILALRSYLAVRPNDKVKGDHKKALFISRLYKRMGRQAVQNMVYHYLEEIGLDGQHYSVHKLRHTAATLMYQHGDVDVLVIKDMLGHENLTTTEIYTHLENKQLRAASKSNPLSMETLGDDDSGEHE